LVFTGHDIAAQIVRKTTTLLWWHPCLSTGWLLRKQHNTKYLRHINNCRLNTIIVCSYSNCTLNLIRCREEEYLKILPFDYFSESFCILFVRFSLHVCPCFVSWHELERWWEDVGILKLSIKYFSR
jgi:hypothetical protein